MDPQGVGLGLQDLIRNPTLIETFVDILLCAVPIWLAVIIGLVIGWSWRPRWSGLLFLGFRSKFRFFWAPPGFGARRLWLAFTALSAFSVLRRALLGWGNKPKQAHQTQHHGIESSAASGSASAAAFDGGGSSNVSSGISLSSSSRASDDQQNVVSESDLEHLLYLLEAKDGEISWQSMMERTTSNMTYQAWRHDPEDAPTVYRSRTVFEDASAELVRDFFWDDEFRPKWDPMLTYCKILEECPQTGTTIVHWIKKFPFFCSDREYIIGRRIWEAGKAYYCITKAVPYSSLPKRDKPRRVEHYFSSWVIRPAASLKGDGHMTACEVTLVHYEDMGIPKDVAKLGVRHGMWGTVKKLHAGMRTYQNVYRSESSVSRSALMARMTTKISLGSNTVTEGVSDEEKSGDLNLNISRKKGIEWKWVAIGGVALICGMRTGVLGKALLIGAGRAMKR